MAYQRYTPKRPIKSFQDLEVYQRLLAAGVVIFKRVEGDKKEDKRDKSSGEIGIIEEIGEKLQRVVLNLPHQIALAHSLRFVDMKAAIKLLDEIMHDCNQVVVLLEQYRDLCNEKIEHEFFEEQIGDYLRTRWKIMHLARSWEKFSSFSRDGNPREIS